MARRCSADLRARFRDAFAIPLHNAYGPTEAAVDITQFTCTDDPGPVPIGRPNANARVYVLDERLRLGARRGSPASYISPDRSSLAATRPVRA